MSGWAGECERARCATWKKGSMEERGQSGWSSTRAGGTPTESQQDLNSVPATAATAPPDDHAVLHHPTRLQPPQQTPPAHPPRCQQSQRGCGGRPQGCPSQPYPQGRRPRRRPVGVGVGAGWGVCVWGAMIWAHAHAHTCTRVNTWDTSVGRHPALPTPHAAVLCVTPPASSTHTPYARIHIHTPHIHTPHTGLE